jgi:HAD superfamily hydrolase (TIGR01459 family)
LTPHFSALASNYDVLLCDVWGVVHNGEVAFPAVCDALIKAREAGVTVVFITNSPRPGEAVIRQLDGLQVPHEAYDGIVSSGDVTRHVIAQRKGETLCHIGPDRDRAIFTGLDVTFAPLQQAGYVVCSGLEDDERETPEDYRARLEIIRARGLFMVCANPDLVVERGARLVYCAGSVAELYETMGGEVLYAGKPYRPIYERALQKAQGLRDGKIDSRRVLAIGDSLRTDFAGARNFGVDFLFMTAGIHAEELGDRAAPDLARLQSVLAATGHQPTAVMRELAW